MTNDNAERIQTLRNFVESKRVLLGKGVPLKEAQRLLASIADAEAELARLTAENREHAQR